MADRSSFPLRPVQLVPDIPLRPIGVALQRAADIYRSTGPQGLVGLNHQAHTNQAILNVRRMIQTFEGCTFDRVLYIGPQELPLSRPSKFEWLLQGCQEGTINPDDIVLVDDKSSQLHLKYWTLVQDRPASDTERNAYWTLKNHGPVQKKGVQYQHVSFYHLTFRNQSGLSCIIPKSWNAHRFIGPMGVSLPDYMVPLAFPLTQSETAWESFIDAIRHGHEWSVPGTGVRFKPRDFVRHTFGKKEMKRFFCIENDAAFRGFRQLKHSIESLLDGFEVDFCDYPWAGDAMLRSSADEYLIEIKDGLVSETDTLVIVQIPLWDNVSSEQRKARSMFHPLRTWHYICLFFNNGQDGYWIPRSVIQKSWWTAEEITRIDKTSVKPFRFSMSGGSSHFRDVVLGVLEKYPDPVTPDSMKQETVHEDVKRFASYYIKGNADSEDSQSDNEDGKDDKHDEDDEDNGDENSGKAASSRRIRSPRDKGGIAIERFNIAAHAVGFGMMLEYGGTFPFCRSAFLPRIWSDEDNAVYAGTGRTMRVELNSGHLSPCDPLLPISWVPLAAGGGSAHKTNHPEVAQGYVNPGAILELDKAVVLAVNLMGETESDLRGSTLLIPLECVDRPGIYRYLSRAAGRDVSSWKEYRESCPDAHGTYIDLREFLYGRFLFDFLVRNGEEYYNAVVEFANAHANRTTPDEPIHVNWYKHQGSVRINGKWQDLGPLTVTGNYLWSFQELAQKSVDTLVAQWTED